MAYRKTPSRRAPARGARRSPVRRPARRSARKSGVRKRSAASRPHTIKLVIEHSTAAGEGMGGLAMPQITSQNKRSKF